MSEKLTALTVSRVRGWNPGCFAEVASEWELAQFSLAGRMTQTAGIVDGSLDYFKGRSGNSMRVRFNAVDTETSTLTTALSAGATAARAAAGDLTSHRSVVLGKVTDAEANKYSVADDGTVSVSTQQRTVLFSSSSPMLAMKALGKLQDDADARTTALQKALVDIAVADVRAESAIIDAFKELPGAPGTSAAADGKIPTPPAFDADPQYNRHWWNQLTPEQQRAVIADNPTLIGNRDGIPYWARDEANQNRIPELRSQLEAEQTVAASTYGRDSQQYKDVTNRLNDLRAVEATLKQADTKLVLLDLTAGRQGRAAIAVGDPDKADHISVTAPGLNTRVDSSIGSMVEEATLLRKEAAFQLQNAGRGTETVATIAWIGFDAPQVDKPLGEGDWVAAARGGADVGTTERAREGGAALGRFYDGLEVAHSGSQPPHITAVGHSYGSLTTGLAMQQTNGSPVTDMVVYGSPGIAADTPQDLGLEPGHVYVMRADDDPIRWVHDWTGPAKTPIPVLPTPLGPLPNPLPIIANEWENQDYGGFGPDPATNPNFNHLDTHAGQARDGSERYLDGARGHSEYPRPSGDTPRMTGYNVAAIVAGLPGNAVYAK